MNDAEWIQIQADYYAAIDQEEKQLAQELGVPQECAAAVLYLRTRSRWTPDMEARLIESYKNPALKPVPLADVLSGEWR